MGFPVNFPSNQPTKHYFVIIPATLQLASTNLTKCPFRQSLHRAKLPWRSPAKSRCRAQNCGHVGHALYVYTYIIYIVYIHTLHVGPSWSTEIGGSSQVNKWDILDLEMLPSATGEVKGDGFPDKCWRIVHEHHLCGGISWNIMIYDISWNIMNYIELYSHMINIEIYSRIVLKCIR